MTTYVTSDSPMVTDTMRSAISMRYNASYEAIQSHLIIRPLNLKSNAQRLRNAVYSVTGDIALVLYQLVGKTDKQLATSIITGDDLTRWNVTAMKEKILQEALSNTARLYPAVTCSARDYRELDVLKDAFTKEEVTTGRFIMLSTHQAVNGALSVFYPGVREKMLEIFHGPFCAVFMNTTDVLLFAADEDPSVIRSALQTAEAGPQFGEKLSSMPYLCDTSGIHPDHDLL